jgi:hypothetical protein
MHLAVAHLGSIVERQFRGQGFLIVLKELAVIDFNGGHIIDPGDLSYGKVVRGHDSLTLATVPYAIQIKLAEGDKVAWSMGAVENFRKIKLKGLAVGLNEWQRRRFHGLRACYSPICNLMYNGVDEFLNNGKPLFIVEAVV